MKVWVFFVFLLCVWAQGETATSDFDEAVEDRAKFSGKVGELSKANNIRGLFELLKTESDSTNRCEVVKSLVKLSPRDAASQAEFVKLLDTSDPSVSMEALGYFNQNVNEDTIQGLVNLIAASTPTTSNTRYMSAIRALNRIGPEAERAMVKELRSDMSNVRRGAADVLRKSNDPHYLPILHEALRNEKGAAFDRMFDSILSLAGDAGWEKELKQIMATIKTKDQNEDEVKRCREMASTLESHRDSLEPKQQERFDALLESALKAEAAASKNRPKDNVAALKMLVRNQEAWVGKYDKEVKGEHPIEWALSLRALSALFLTRAQECLRKNHQADPPASQRSPDEWMKELKGLAEKARAIAKNRPGPVSGASIYAPAFYMTFLKDRLQSEKAKTDPKYAKQIRDEIDATNAELTRDLAQYAKHTSGTRGSLFNFYALSSAIRATDFKQEIDPRAVPPILIASGELEDHGKTPDAPRPASEPPNEMSAVAVLKNAVDNSNLNGYPYSPKGRQSASKRSGALRGPTMTLPLYEKMKNGKNLYREPLIKSLKDFREHIPAGVLALCFSGSDQSAHEGADGLASYFLYSNFPVAAQAINALQKDPDLPPHHENYLQKLRADMNSFLIDRLDRDNLFSPERLFAEGPGYNNPLAGLALIELTEGCSSGLTFTAYLGKDPVSRGRRGATVDGQRAFQIRICHESHF